MAKKKVSGNRPRNGELRGGINTLPKKVNGTVDIKKVVKKGAQEQKKKWTDKKVVKDRTTPKQAITEIKKANRTKPQPAKGLSKLKAVAKANMPQVSSTPPKKTPQAKGVSKLKAVAPKQVATTKKDPVKKAPVKGR